MLLLAYVSLLLNARHMFKYRWKNRCVWPFEDLLPVKLFWGPSCFHFPWLAASSEAKPRIERFCRRHKWHSRVRGTSSVPRRRKSTREGYYECETSFWEAAKELWLRTWIPAFVTSHDLAWCLPTGWSWVRWVREGSPRDHCLEELKRGHAPLCM